MSQIRDILGQMDHLTQMGNFNLWPLRNLQKIVKESIEPYDGIKVERQLRLKQAEYRIYRLI
jgi:hypothetical protein